MTAFKLKAQVPTEKQEMAMLLGWIAFQPRIRDLVFHIPNEYDGGAFKGLCRRRQGVRKGVSDLCIPLPTKSHHGMFLELKRRYGAKATKEQIQWIDKMNALGYAAKICYGLDDAVEFIQGYLASDS